jgi:nitroimidazol reductase NimA-like FMN-containing flavoprotein (pyridoxamine 5'-phosphate oxidase superfamily)
MFVDKMNHEECVRVLAEAPVARLACAAENQPYVVPVYLAYYRAADVDECLYGFTTMGQKIEWMRANPRVCVEVDQVSGSSEWVSVVAFGQYEEIPNVHEQVCGRAPERSSLVGRRRSKAVTWEPANEQLLAHRLLEDRAMWWEPASSVRTGIENGDHPNHITPVFYKISLTQVTGYRARQEEVVKVSQLDADSGDRPAIVERLRRSFGRWRGVLSPRAASPCRSGRCTHSADTLRNAR